MIFREPSISAVRTLVGCIQSVNCHVTTVAEKAFHRACSLPWNASDAVNQTVHRQQRHCQKLGSRVDYGHQDYKEQIQENTV